MTVYVEIFRCGYELVAYRLVRGGRPGGALLIWQLRSVPYCDRTLPLVALHRIQAT